MPRPVISEIILEKIKGKKVEGHIKELVEEILDVEKRHMLIRYPRFSEDYDRIISKYLARLKK